MIKSTAQITSYDDSYIDPKDYGAIGDGKLHRVAQRYNSLEAARLRWPGCSTLDDTVDWCAAQTALDYAAIRIKESVPYFAGDSIARTGRSWSPTVRFSPGDYVINRPLMRYPHVPIRGTSWSNTTIRLADDGWSQFADRLTTNRQGTVWCGNISGKSALLWILCDQEWPALSGRYVAEMEDEISNLTLICHDGPALYFDGNTNLVKIHDLKIKGYGAGPTGIGIVSNNATSSTQITNLAIGPNVVIEGCVAAIVLDKVVEGNICAQIESCQNGIFVAHGKGVIISGCVLSNDIPNKPFGNGIFIGVSQTCIVANNIISDIEQKAIKTLGDVNVQNNKIVIKNGAQINHSGYAIHIVTPANQFGGDTSVLAGLYGPVIITGNSLRCDVKPKSKPLPGFPNPKPLDPIFLDEAAGELIYALVSDNLLI